MGKIMFACSLDHMSGGDAWHCLVHCDNSWKTKDTSSEIFARERLLLERYWARQKESTTIGSNYRKNYRDSLYQKQHVRKTEQQNHVVRKTRNTRVCNNKQKNMATDSLGIWWRIFRWSGLRNCMCRKVTGKRFDLCDNLKHTTETNFLEVTRAIVSWFFPLKLNWIL